jgi:hypothetical protein
MYQTVLRVRRLPRLATASTGVACELELASEAVSDLGRAGWNGHRVLDT